MRCLSTRAIGILSYVIVIDGLLCRAKIPRPFQDMAVCTVPLDMEISCIADRQILPLDSSVTTEKILLQNWSWSFVQLEDVSSVCALAKSSYVFGSAFCTSCVAGVCFVSDVRNNVVVTTKIKIFVFWMFSVMLHLPRQMADSIISIRPSAGSRTRCSSSSWLKKSVRMKRFSCV